MASIHSVQMFKASSMVQNKNVSFKKNPQQVVAQPPQQESSQSESFGWKKTLLVGGLGAAALAGVFVLGRRCPGKVKQNSDTVGQIKRNVEEMRKTINEDGNVGFEQKIKNIIEKHDGLIQELKSQIEKCKITSEPSGAYLEKLDELEAKYARKIADVLHLQNSSNAPIPLPKRLVGERVEMSVNCTKRIKENAWRKIRSEMADSFAGKYRKIEKLDPQDVRLVSVSYEGPGGHAAGGQYDIATQLPDALAEQGVPTWNIGPAVNYVKKNAAGEITTRFGIFAKKDGSFTYACPRPLTSKSKPAQENGACIYSVEKIGDFGLPDNGTNMAVYYEPKTKTFLLQDDKYFDFGEATVKNTYENLPNSSERIRMAQFNNMTFEFLNNCMEGKIKVPMTEGGAPETLIPNRMVAHEAWQSGGLFQKLKLLTHAREADGTLTSDSAEKLRTLADSSVMPVHNCGPAYQNGFWKEIPEYMDAIFGGYSHDMMIATDLRLLDLPKDMHTLGLIRDYYNPAMPAAILARYGAVSSGYQTELGLKLKEGADERMGMFSAELVPIFQKRNHIVNGGLPNGVDIAPFEPSVVNINAMNKNFQKAERGGFAVDSYRYIDEAGQQHSGIMPYLTEDGKTLSLKEFSARRKHNQQIFLDMLKKQVGAENGEWQQTPLFKNSKVVKGWTTFDISTATVDTPIYSTVSRFDDQKGISTTLVAYEKLMREWSAKKLPEEKRPILLAKLNKVEDESGHFEKLIKEMEERLKKDGVPHRFVHVNGFLLDDGLQLVNMTTRPIMFSDFEPFGISDVKGLYAGSHILATNVGGMNAANKGKIGEKVVGVFAGVQKNPTEFKPTVYNGRDSFSSAQNAVLVGNGSNYVPFVTINDSVAKKEQIQKNGEEIFEALMFDSQLTRAQTDVMDKNALQVDCSWKNGAVQNYMRHLNINTEKSV